VRHVRCDVCGRDEPLLFARKQARRDVLHERFVRCRGCRFVYADPRADEDDARAFYDSVSDRGSGVLGAAPGGRSWRAAVAARRRHLEPAAAAAAPDRQMRYFEIGFGDGSGLAAALELGWEAYGCEYAAWLVDAAQERLPQAHVHVGDVADAPVEAGSIDVMYAWHVVEHVLDIHAWLEVVARLLRPGGMLILGTENADSLYGRLFMLPARLLRRTPLPPTSTDHTYWFTASALATLLREHGLRPDQVVAYENSPRTIAASQPLSSLRNPRWLVVLALYLATAAVARAVPRTGGKLRAVAVKG
jgi:2-polyprenyl-3-methyl-5-hydroxy-6-metoxy-1,4-benzoquinol methylase